MNKHILEVPICKRRHPPETNHAVVNGNGSSGDLEVMKQEILQEMRKETNKAKKEIIDGEKTFKTLQVENYQ